MEGGMRIDLLTNGDPPSGGQGFLLHPHFEHVSNLNYSILGDVGILYIFFSQSSSIEKPNNS